MYFLIQLTGEGAEVPGVGKLAQDHTASIPGGSDGKESACSPGNPSSILGSGRCPGGGNSNPLQYSYLENSIDRGAWWAVAHSVAKESDTTERVTHS